MRASLCIVPLSLLLGCASAKTGSGFGNPDGGAGSGGPALGGGPGLTDEAGAPLVKACSDAAKLVYLVSGDNNLYSFDPSQLKFTLVGPLQCPAGSAHPFSMGVDRGGNAFVNYDDGSVYKVSTADASCVKTGYVPQNGFTTFGMGFASDSPGSDLETLYVCGINDQSGGGKGLGLGKLDTKTMQLTYLGNYTGTLNGDAAELTGTGDAQLYGFFEGTPAILANIDKGTAATPQPISLTGVQIGQQSAFAFSFWGGDFWFYTMEPNQAGSSVTRYKAATDKSVAKVLSNVGFEIVGAGVSTCAPTVPTK